jgi:methionyl aminopeptidase
MGIVLKNRQQIAKMREAGQVVAATLDAVEAACVPGVTTAELDRIAERVLTQSGCRSAFRGYSPRGAVPYPAVLCTSRNHEVVHGLPSEDAVLAEGDLISIDFACFKDGYCADAARTVAVGVVSAPARRLLEVTRQALIRAIAGCTPDARLGDIGSVIEQLASASGFAVVPELTGHGIGRAMHETPEVRNFGRPGSGLRLRPGLTIAIEPILTAGDPAVHTLDDDWTVVTADHSLSAHFEHTVAVTEDGPVVLTAAG